MLLMLDLICTMLKYCALLTSVRLASTAFGWEFGVSRQYLRLLELLFRFGQKRIEKVESEHKFQLINKLNQFAACDRDDELRPTPQRDSLSLPLNESEPTEANGLRQEETPRRRRFNGAAPGQASRPQRRISTPEGPPVFLLDHNNDDSDSDEDQSNCQLFCNEQSELTKRDFQLPDACRFVARGVSAIIDDQVTKRFTPEELKTWNLLTRTNAKNYQFMSRSLGLYWLSGFLFRYAILLPMRIMFSLAGFAWLICTMTLVGLLPKGLRARPYRLMSLMSFRMLSCGITSKLTFHNRQYRPKNGQICVANHTSPLDVVLLACDNCYALVGQRHGGLLGVLEYYLSRATNHVWFDRSEMRDRQLVTTRLKEHVSNKTNLPVLIFPEGTCINNSAVMMFRKGSFETTDCVCPVALKYDARFGDPFWDSSKQSYVRYLLLMMSSWAIKCDVWYLAPMQRLPGETSAEFAGRVKAEIAKQGGLADLAWDGQLKRTPAKEVWKHQQQEDFVNRLNFDQ